MKSLLRFGLAVLLLAGCSRDEGGIHPRHASLTESVYASVTVQPEGFYRVYPAVPGLLDSLYVAEGDTVVAGQLIAKMVTATPELLRENALLNKELAAEKLKGNANMLATLEQEIAGAREQLTLDSLNFLRQKNLFDQEIGSRVTFENQKLRYEQSLNNLAILEQRYAQARTELRNAYARSKNALAQAETKLREHLIYARISGKVYALNKEAGEYVLNQEAIAQLGSRDSFIVEMAVDEVDIARLRLGQRALVVLDAYGEEVFEAVLSKIYPKKDERSQTFKAEAEFAEAPEVLYAGLSGEANILLQTKERALIIPVTYLGAGSRVRVDTGTVPVEVGLRSMESVEILSGIDSSTVIYKP